MGKEIWLRRTSRTAISQTSRNKWFIDFIFELKVGKLFILNSIIPSRGKGCNFVKISQNFHRHHIKEKEKAQIIGDVLI